MRIWTFIFSHRSEYICWMVAISHRSCSRKECCGSIIIIIIVVYYSYMTHIIWANEQIADNANIRVTTNCPLPYFSFNHIISTHPTRVFYLRNVIFRCGSHLFFAKFPAKVFVFVPKFSTILMSRIISICVSMYFIYKYATRTLYIYLQSSVQ